MKSCKTCVYMWFKKLDHFCYHPDYNKPLKRLTGCKKWQSATKKTMPPHNRGYIEPVTH